MECEAYHDEWSGKMVFEGKSTFTVIEPANHRGDLGSRLIKLMRNKNREKKKTVKNTKRNCN